MIHLFVRTQFSNSLTAFMISWLLCSSISASLIADMTDVMNQFRENHPQAQFYGSNFYEHENFFDEAGTASTIYGTTFSQGATPVESAWNNIDEIRDLLGTEIGELVPTVQSDGTVPIGVMWNRKTENFKFWTFRFEQVYQGIPVFRSGVGFLVRNEPNNPLVMATYDVRDLKGMKLDVDANQPPVMTKQIMDSAREFFNAKPVAKSVLKPKVDQKIIATEQRRVIFSGTQQRIAEPKLAIEFVATKGSIKTAPNFQRYRIVADATTGEILLTENMILHEDVSGTVRGRATDGLGAAMCHDQSPTLLPYAEVEIIGGNSTFATVDGAFTLANPDNANVTVRSWLRGEWFEVFDQFANDLTPFIDQTITPPGPVDFLHNPAVDNETQQANVNTYFEANVVRDYALFYVPNFPTIATQTKFDINTNQSTTCNATYTGDAINFRMAGGGCSNSGFSDVVYHEYGHHLVATSGNGQGQMGEGCSDTMGVLIQDEPVVSLGWNNCNSGLRDARNFRIYPCNGAIHDCGQLISGCVWDLRNELILTEPSDYRDIGATLFLNMLLVRGQSFPGNRTIGPEITLIYLELDDDDGDLNNGTPHCIEITTAFDAHNLDGLARGSLQFEFPNGQPDLLDPAGASFSLQINDGICTELQPSSVTLHLDSSNGDETISLTGTGNTYSVAIPPTDCGQVVSYFFSAESTDGRVSYFPKQAETNSALRFTVAVADELNSQFIDSFDSNQGWLASGDATTGGWERGIPEGGGDRGDPATDADGSDFCFVTENTDGNFDIDDGRVTLTSPILDTTSPGTGDVFVSYYRWFSNGGASEDTMIVEVSSDGGATWVLLEVVPQMESAGGWIKKFFRVADFVTPGNNFRFRVHAEDIDTPSVVEAGIDRFEIVIFECGDAIDVPPSALDVFRGNQIAGTIEDLEFSDDIRMAFNPGFTINGTEAPVWLIFDAVLPSSPNTLSLEIESAANTPSITRQIEVFNFDKQQLETVDIGAESFNTDSTFTIDLSNEHYNSNNAVTARVGWRQTGFTILFPWTISVDQVVWQVDQ